MKKTHLEERIKERAKKRFDREMKKIGDFFLGNDILSNLLVEQDGEEKKISYDTGVSRDIRTNLEVVEKYLLDKYEEEETDRILEKLRDTDYLDKR